MHRLSGFAESYEIATGLVPAVAWSHSGPTFVTSEVSKDSRPELGLLRTVGALACKMSNSMFVQNNPQTVVVLKDPTRTCLSPPASCRKDTPNTSLHMLGGSIVLGEIHSRNDSRYQGAARN